MRSVLAQYLGSCALEPTLSRALFLVLPLSFLNAVPSFNSRVVVRVTGNYICKFLAECLAVGILWLLTLLKRRDNQDFIMECVELIGRRSQLLLNT